MSKIKSAGRLRSIKQDRKALLGADTPFSIREEYKLLRASTAFAAAAGGDSCKIVGVTSALPEEGKSITCLNLAVAFAQTQARVLVLDCDLRKPTVARYFSIYPSPGMSNVLAGMSSPDEAVCRVECGGAKFCVVPSGDIPPNPSELLGTERMGAVLGEMSERFDYVFIDLPPVLPVSDPLVLSGRLTGVVIVVQAGQTKKDEVRATLERLKLAQTNVLGFVLNRVQSSGGGRRYYARRYGAYA
ncbi:MAG: CpsD/CapB family tyrosine-protein kinase [Oscillospiraceae bacterium]|nr:CpsD/CapB family tyrosine-protein kinase [Oscillospiraceae bacterium]